MTGSLRRNTKKYATFSQSAITKCTNKKWAKIQLTVFFIFHTADTVNVDLIKREKEMGENFDLNKH